MLANERLGRLDSFRVEDVEVERRHQPGEHAGIARVRPGALPHVDLFGGYFVQFLPASQPFACIVLAVGGWRFAEQRDGAESGGAQLVPQFGWRIHAALPSLAVSSIWWVPPAPSLAC